jgi:hypothetical protein
MHLLRRKKLVNFEQFPDRIALQGVSLQSGARAMFR